MRLSSVCQAGCWQILLLLPCSPLQPFSTRPAPAASSSPSPGLVSSLPSLRAECEVEKILPGKQPKKRCRRTPTFFPAELNISGNVAKKTHSTPTSRGALPKREFLTQWRLPGEMMWGAGEMQRKSTRMVRRVEKACWKPGVLPLPTWVLGGGGIDVYKCIREYVPRQGRGERSLLQNGGSGWSWYTVHLWTSAGNDQVSSWGMLWL